MKLLVTLFLAFLLSSPASASWSIPSSFSDTKSEQNVNVSLGKKITKVVFLDEKNTPEFVKQHAMSAYMQVFHPALLRDLLRWFNANQLDTRIELYLEANSSDSLTLLVGFKERVKIVHISFEGNTAVSSNTLANMMDLKDGMDFDPIRVDESTARVLGFYNQQGYLNAEIKTKLSDAGELTFQVIEGAATVVSSISMTEIKSVENKILRKRYAEQLQTEFGILAGERIERDRVQLGLQNIKNWLRDHDFLTAKDPTITYSLDEGGGVRIHVNIDYGSRIRFGFRGNKQFSYRELIEFVGDVKEISSGGDYLDAVRRRIIEAYRDIGLVNISINTLVREDPEKGIRYVSLIMSEGEKVQVTGLHIEGVYSMDASDAESKFNSFGSRLVQRHFFHEKGIGKSAELFSDYLKSEGYLSAKLEFSKTIFSQDRKKVDVTLLFNEGIRTVVQDIKVNGIKSLSQEEVRSILGIKEGEPFNIFRFEQGLVSLKNKYEELGNLNMRIDNEGTDSLVKYSKDSANVSLEIDIDEGATVHVGEILVRGNQETHARVVLRELPFIGGDVLTKPLLNEAEDNLRKLSLFTSVVVRTVDHPGDEAKKDILILIEESIPGSFEITPGFRNDLGLRLGVGATYQNLGGWNRSVTAQAVVNHRTSNYHFPEYDINLGFREPYLAEWPVTLTSNLEFLRHQYNNFDAIIDKLTTSVRRDLTKNFSVFLEYSYEQDNIQNARSPYSQSDNRDSFIGALTPGFIVDTRNDTFNPSRGFYSINRFELATHVFGSEQDIGYYRTTTSNTVYIPAFGGTTFALAMSLGWERSNVSGSAIPTFKLFRLGGIGSLRGYDDDSIEVETSTTVNGTLGLANYRGEYRVPISGAFGTAVFLDAGNLMIDRFAPFAVRSSAGAGLRYVTPVGPVALDIAWKLQSDATVGNTTVPSGDRYKVHFAIGSF